jgi:hypothetical protein
MTDAPMPLEVAIRRFFPEGGVTIDIMRAAIRKGELTCERIGRSYFVTPQDVRDWRHTCRAKGSRPGFGLGNGKGESRDGSLSMAERKSTLAAALAITKGLRKSSVNTSRRIAGSTPAPGTPLKLVSQT